MPSYTTVEYEIQGRQSIPPVFLIVIDTTVDAKELNSLKDALQQNLAYLPDNALVGIISFGTHVEVHELTQTEISRSYVFNGTKEYPTSKVADMLGLRGSVAQSQVAFPRFSDLDRRLHLRLAVHHALRRLFLGDRHASQRVGEGSRCFSPLFSSRSGPWARSTAQNAALAALCPWRPRCWRSPVRNRLLI